MPSVKVAHRSDLRPGSLREATHGDTAVAICNYEGEIHAVHGTCPHRGGPLAEGTLHGNMLVCPWHAWEFDCVTGANDFNPNVVLPKYVVSERNGDIYVDIP
jgi:nitrite reductase (NADH) small subunit